MITISSHTYVYGKANDCWTVTRYMFQLDLIVVMNRSRM
jgi:hypothetical protein